jgi:transcription antitermination protein NusB
VPEIIDNDELSSQLPTRRLAREIALRAFYAMEIRGCSVEQALFDPLIAIDGAPLPYTSRLLKHLSRYREQLDALIREKVKKWEFHRIAIIDKAILRMAITELLYFPDVPPKVTINEAIEIAKKFSTDKSSKFVNGILDAVYVEVVQGKIAMKPLSKDETTE